jgi:hypothetical protein
MPILGLHADVLQRTRLKKYIVDVLLKTIILAKAVGFVVKLAQAVGTLPQSPD